MGCREDLPWISAGCERCGAPLPQDAGPGRCARCDLVLGSIDRVQAALVYEWPVDHLVLAAKFAGRIDCACALGELLARPFRTGRLRVQSEVVIPVPLHRSRFGRRGYNQAAIIGAALAGAVGLPMREALCRRRRNTSAQSGLEGRARRANVQGAFVAHPEVAGVTVALVDDVVTTGHTLSSVARALREAGAAGVEAWCAARVVAGQGARKM